MKSQLCLKKTFLVNCLNNKIDFTDFPMNCEQVKKAGWSLPNWFYGIDPDGPGGNPPFQVPAIITTCLYKLKLYKLKTFSPNSVYLTMV